MSKIDKHELSRCVFCELQFQNMAADVEYAFLNSDEICTQLYMDVLGHGINTIL